MVRIYKKGSDIILESAMNYKLLRKRNWDEYINDDELFAKVIHDFDRVESIEIEDDLNPDCPMGSQELWASGVTYYRSMQGRQEESKEAGGGQFYAHVYDAPRPELFFKANRHRVVGHMGNVRIRRDSTWDVPEPELVLFITSNGKIVGYSIGNDMSSRSIEGENPLYLPQAKTFDGCAALGPCILASGDPLSPETMIGMSIVRAGEIVFEDAIALSRMKRSPEELAGYLYRECSFPNGCFLMTGTGIVPGADFTLKSGDIIEISIDLIGKLTNIVT